MKKIIISVAIIAMSLHLSAQIENVKMISDSSLILERAYIGGIGMSSFSIDSTYVSNYSNLRIGARIHWNMTKWMTFNSYYMYQAETDQSWGLNQFSLKISPYKKWSFEFGNMSTLSTQQRPKPVSEGGQFETWSEAQIPGGGLGIKTSYQPTKNVSFGIGVASRNIQPEYHANVRFKKITLSGYYDINQKAGAALSYTGSKAWTTLVWKQDKVIANMFGCIISKKHNILIYTDMGYDLETNTLVRGEWGIYKMFSNKYCNILPCLGYNYENKTIRGYLFIYI